MKKLKKFYLLLSILVLGIIFGIIFINIINDVDKLLIKNEIKDFISVINTSKTSILSSLLNAFTSNLILYFIVWCSGFIFILMPISYFIVFYKGFLLGFLSASLVYIFKLKGLLYTLVFIFPHEILNILFMVFFVFVISKFSKKFILVIFKDNNYDLRVLIKKYFLLLLGIIIVCIILALLEVFINYYLIKAMF